MSQLPTRPDVGLWENTTRRLRRDKARKDKHHLLIGRGLTQNIYLPLPVLLNHLHIVGRSGGGKSAFLAALVAQIIRGHYGNVVVITFKKDPALFHGVRIEAEDLKLNPRYKFKWFGTEPFLSSYVFNPRQQSILTLQTLREQIATYLQGLGLDHSKRQDLAFFGAMTETVFQTYMAAFSASSLSELFFIMDDPGTYTRLGNKADWNHSRHITAQLNRLGFFLSLNATPEQYPVPLEAQIDVVDLLLNPGRVVYFDLPAGLDDTAGASIARLFLFLLMSAATRLEGLVRLQPLVVILDEFQVAVGEQVSRIAEQARGKFGLVFSHQGLSQLRLPTGVDLAPVLARACGAQILFDSLDPEGIEYIVRTSPEVERPAYGWNQPFSPRMDLTHPGALSPLRSLELPRHSGEPAILNVHLERRPALTVNDIVAISTDPTMAFARFLKDEAFACFQGAWQPTRLEYHIDRIEFEKRANMKWPPPNPETVVNPLISSHQLTLARGMEIEGPTTDVPPAALDAAFVEELRRVSGESSKGRRKKNQQ
jgi:hypothetical protein